MLGDKILENSLNKLGGTTCEGGGGATGDTTTGDTTTGDTTTGTNLNFDQTGE